MSAPLAGWTYEPIEPGLLPVWQYTPLPVPKPVSVRCPGDVTVTQLTRHLGRTDTTFLYHAIHAGKLRTHRHGCMQYIAPADFEAWQVIRHPLSRQCDKGEGYDSASLPAAD